MADSVQTAVLGVSGYAGMELARLLLHHPRLKGHAPVFLGRAEAGQDSSLAALHPQLMDNNGSAALKIEPFSWDLLKSRGVDSSVSGDSHMSSRENMLLWPSSMASALSTSAARGGSTSPRTAPSTNLKTTTRP